MIQVRRGVASGNACGPPLGDRRADRLGASRTPRSAAGDPGVPAWLLEGVSEEIRVPFKLLSWHDDKKPDMSQTFSKKCFTGCMAFDILFHAPKSAAVRAVSSGVEHYLDTVGVTSSNLVSPTTNSTGHREVPVACFALLEDVGLNRSKHRRFATACLATRLAVLALERGRHVLIAFRCDELLVYIGNVAVRLIDRFEHLEHGISVQIKE